MKAANSLLIAAALTFACTPCVANAHPGTLIVVGESYSSCAFDPKVEPDLCWPEIVRLESGRAVFNLAIGGIGGTAFSWAQDPIFSDRHCPESFTPCEAIVMIGFSDAALGRTAEEFLFDVVAIETALRDVGVTHTYLVLEPVGHPRNTGLTPAMVEYQLGLCLLAPHRFSCVDLSEDLWPFLPILHNWPWPDQMAIHPEGAGQRFIASRILEAIQ
jgi:hypothetical protein